MFLAIDVGGTKVLVTLFSNDGKIEKSIKIKTPTDYAGFLTELKKTITKVKGTHELKACSIAMPGKIDRDNGVAIAFGNLSWKNIHIRDDLSDVLSCPIYIENDANLAGLAEATSLLKEFRKTLYITVSTGIGGILVVDGVMDPNTIDAEIGQSLLEHSGQLMRWEEFASGRAIVKHTGKMASEITDEKDWYLVARNIAVGLINVIAAYTPECVVIGGGVGSHLEKFQEKLYGELEIYKNDLIELPQIRKAQHPEEAVVYGGYLLAQQNLAHHNDTK